MEYIPFYKRSSSSNIITKEDIEIFKTTNPSLSEIIGTHSIELKLLELNRLESLCSWIISQQISGFVADMLIDRFFNLVKPFNEQTLLEFPENKLKEIGLSKNKIHYVKNVAEFFINNNLIDEEKSTSDEIRSFYKQIKGIGEWTVNMHLIFVVGKKDILAKKDLVVRKGIKKLYNLKSIPSEKFVEYICRGWGEKATIGTILSWTVLGE